MCLYIYIYVYIICVKWIISYANMVENICPMSPLEDLLEQHIKHMPLLHIPAGLTLPEPSQMAFSGACRKSRAMGESST